MYKSKEKQRESDRERAKRYRDKKKGVTQGVTPAIVKALTDPKKRAMLEYLSMNFKRQGVADKVWYGVGGPDFVEVEKLLEVTA